MPGGNRGLISDYSRLWLTKWRSGPANAPQYESIWRADAPSWSLGSIKPIYVPRPDQYGQFDNAGKIIGERGLPMLTVTAKYLEDARSVLLDLARANCDCDLQLHIGLCADPRDFNLGWDKILCLDAALPTDWKASNMGALGPSERTEVLETVSFSGEDLYEIMRIVFAEQAAAQIVQKVVGITICDRAVCGACGIPSDGCSVVFAVTLSNGGSPGLSAEVISTADGGATWDGTHVTTLAANEDPTGLACVGTNLVVISKDSVSLHYAPSADILGLTETWTEVTTGFVVSHGPAAIWSADPQHTWIVGAGGYIYWTEDPTSGVEVQSAGVGTVQDLTAITGIDALHLAAVGASNAMLVTDNGGETWAAITGPAVGVALTCVAMQSETCWFVGTAGGKLFYTLDGGSTWTEKAFPGSGAGTVYDIKFANGTVGYLAHSTATPAGRILRTVNGGFSWYVAPENNTRIPANDAVVSLAVCQDDVNVVYGAGLGDNAVDGFIVAGK